MAERDQALDLIDRHRGASTRRITLGADKSYDVTDFVGELSSRAVTPHIAIDGHLSADFGERERGFQVMVSSRFI